MVILIPYILMKHGFRMLLFTIFIRTCMLSAKIDLGAKDTIIFSTQSIHKLLAGISQASQILVQDSKTKRFDHNVFNEAYLMHSSTSPQYSIIASLDVAAAMMEPPGGKHWLKNQ